MIICALHPFSFMNVQYSYSRISMQTSNKSGSVASGRVEHGCAGLRESEVHSGK